MRVKAWSLYWAVLHKFSICFLKTSLLSIVIPKSITSLLSLTVIEFITIPFLLWFFRFSIINWDFPALAFNEFDQNSIVKNHLDQCVEVQYLLHITSLGPALFSNDSNIRNADNRNSRINLIIDNTNIIGCYKKFNIILFKEALKEINERKPTLNTGLKASKELQLF